MSGDFAVCGESQVDQMWQKAKKKNVLSSSVVQGWELATGSHRHMLHPFSPRPLCSDTYLIFLHTRVAAFHLQDYETAKVALAACQTLSPEQRTLDSWIRKNDQELAKLPKPTAAPAVPTQTATPVTTATSTPVTSPVVVSTPSMAATPAPAPLTPAALRVRYFYFVTDQPCCR